MTLNLDLWLITPQDSDQIFWVPGGLGKVGSDVFFGVRLVEIIFIINSEIQLDFFFLCVTCGIPAIGRRSNVDFWYAAQGFFSIN